MEDKLKTMKELTHDFCSTEHGKHEGEEFRRKDGSFIMGTATGEFVRAIMKKEALKWIKELEFREARFYPDIEKPQDNSILWSITFIKHFFNIEDGD